MLDTSNDHTAASKLGQVPEMELFSAYLCPYSHRVQLALIEKGVDFWQTEIDLSDKPAWFLMISPLAEVPVVRHEGHFVADSAAILEYLDDVCPSPALRPKTPAKRAMARFWMEYADERFAPTIDRCFQAGTAGERAAAATELSELLTFIEREALARCGRGPYWMGAELSIVDLAFYPFFEWLPAIEQHASQRLPLMSVRLRSWLDVMRQRNSVRATRHRPEDYARVLAARAEAYSRRRRIGNVEYLRA